ncbi:CRISPR-associated protein Csm5 [Candidatus Magnetomoraceae bacterium gMMP-15]
MNKFIPQLKHYTAKLHILSPIHIGTGQELDPFSYVISGKELLLIDLIKWMEQYPEKDKLETMMDTDNFASVRSFIAENIDPEGLILCKIPIESQGLIQTYNKVIQEKDPINQVLISPITRNDVTNQAYIPGSSIKGAIRTAIANHFVKAANVTSKDFRRGRDNYNQKIFGPPAKDPMRCLKLSDVMLNKSDTFIGEAKEISLNPDKSLTPKGHLEAALSLCSHKKSVNYQLKLSIAPFELPFKSHKNEIVNLQFITDAMYRFYVPKYYEEYNKFFYNNKEIQNILSPINEIIANLKTNETLIRIGHFSHIECITLDEVRNPRTRRGKDGRPLPWGTTRTLVNGSYPFGWAKLEFPNMDSKPRVDKFRPDQKRKVQNKKFVKSRSKTTPQKPASPASLDDLKKKYKKM